MKKGSITSGLFRYTVLAGEGGGGLMRQVRVKVSDSQRVSH